MNRALRTIGAGLAAIALLSCAAALAGPAGVWRPPSTRLPPRVAWDQGQQQAPDATRNASETAVAIVFGREGGARALQTITFDDRGGFLGADADGKAVGAAFEDVAAILFARPDEWFGRARAVAAMGAGDDARGEGEAQRGGGEAAVRRRGLLILTDGQRLAGAMVVGVGEGGVDAGRAARGDETPLDAPEGARRGEPSRGGAGGGVTPGEYFTWESPLLGRFSGALDSAAHVCFAPASGVGSGGLPVAPSRRELAAAPVVDEAILANGDRLIGFITDLGAEIEVDAGGAAGRMRVPIERVRALRLSSSRSASRGPLAWLADGSIVRFASIGVVQGQVGAVDQGRGAPSAMRLALTLPTGRTINLPTEALIAITADVHRIAPLAEIAAEGVERSNGVAKIIEPGAMIPGEAGPFWSIGARDITLSGAARLDAAAPEGAVALWAAAALPKRGWQWSEGTLTVWSERSPAARVRLSRQRPESGVQALLAGERLTLTLSPGSAGAGQAFAAVRSGIVVIGGE